MMKRKSFLIEFRLVERSDNEVETSPTLKHTDYCNTDFTDYTDYQ